VIIEEVKWCVRFVAYRSRVRAVRGQSMRIVVFIGLFLIVVGVTLAFVIEANRTITTLDNERLWFKIETTTSDYDVIGSISIYNDNHEFVEQVPITNTAEWQGSILEYEERSLVKIRIDLWYINETVPEMEYIIGRGEIEYIGEVITITIISYWGVPDFE